MSTPKTNSPLTGMGQLGVCVDRTWMATEDHTGAPPARRTRAGGIERESVPASEC
jgi:hypothetical protein